jgi:hypothetical protein
MPARKQTARACPAPALAATATPNTAAAKLRPMRPLSETSWTRSLDEKLAAYKCEDRARAITKRPSASEPARDAVSTAVKAARSSDVTAADNATVGTRCGRCCGIARATCGAVRTGAGCRRAAGRGRGCSCRRRIATKRKIASPSTISVPPMTRATSPDTSPGTCAGAGVEPGTVAAWPLGPPLLPAPGLDPPGTARPFAAGPDGTAGAEVLELPV